MRTGLKRVLSVFLALALVLTGIPGVPAFVSSVKTAKAAGDIEYVRGSEMTDLTGLMNEFGLFVFDEMKSKSHQHTNVIAGDVLRDPEGIWGGNYVTGEFTFHPEYRTENDHFINYMVSFSEKDDRDSLMKIGYRGDTLYVGETNTVEQRGDEYFVNGCKIESSGTVVKDTAGKKYIDLANLRKSFGYYSGQLSELEEHGAAQNLTEQNYRTISTTETSGYTVINLTASDFNSDWADQINVVTAGAAIVINLDLAGCDEFTLPAIGTIINGTALSSHESLCRDPGNNRVLWNFIDSSEQDGNYRGSIEFAGLFTAGTILAPYAKIQTENGINGLIIVNEGVLLGECHRINPSDSLPAPKSVDKADFSLIKTYDGANLEQMRQADRNGLLQNTEFTLKKQDGTVVGTKSLTWNADSRRAEVVFDDISCGEDADTYFYKLVETKAPSGYVLSSVEVDCKVVRNAKTGELETFYKRSTEGDNAYSETFPSFENTQKANIRPSVTMADWTYGEEASEPVLGENSNPGDGEVTYTYYKIERPGRETKLDGKPENAGNYRVVATIAETDAYKGGNASRNFTIHKAENEIDVAFDDVYVHVRESIELSDYLLDDEAVGNITYQIVGPAPGCSVNSNGKFTAGGSEQNITVRITAAGDDNHKAATVDIKVHVRNKAENTTTVEVTGKEYDGEPVSVVINKDSNGGEPKITYQKKNADGEYENIGTNAPTDAGEYRLLVEIDETPRVSGKNILEDFTIEKAPLTITAKDETYTYNGSAQGENEKTYTTDFDSKVTVEGLKGNDALTSVTLNGQETNAGTYTEKIVPKDAVVGENTDNYEITYVSGNLEIEKAKLTITAASQECTYDGAPHSNGGYVVVGLVGTDSVTATVEGSITYPSESPVANVVKSYSFVSGSADNYDVTLVDGELTMKSAGIEITIKAADDTKTYDGTPLTNSTVTITEGELLEGDRLVAEADGSALNVADTETGNNTVKSGYKIMRGDQDVTENYVITVQPGTLTITPAKVTITAKSEAFVYDGGAHSNDGYTVSGLVGDDAIEAVVTGEITFPSESPVENKVVSYEFTSGTPSNYEVTTAKGSLTMTNAEVAITITAADDEWTYDGKSHTNNTVTVTSGKLLPGDTLVAVAGGSVTNVFETVTGNNTITSYKIMHGDEDVTENYAVTTEAGTLTVTPKSVTITAKDKEFTYNGKEQSFPEYTVEGLVGNDAINAVVEGSITYPKDSPVANEVTSYEFTTGDSRNYSVSTKDGKLTMKKADIKITVTAGDGEWVYDGNPHSNAEATLTDGELMNGDVLEATAGGIVTNVSDTKENNNPVTYCRIMHGNEDVTDNYDITTVPGTLTITKAPLTITVKDQQYTFNGDEQGENDTTYSNPDEIAEKVSVDGLCGNDTLTGITMNGTKSDAGAYESQIAASEASIGEDGNATGNYNINYVSGKLTIDPKKVTITAKSEEFTYDGQTHQNNGYDVNGLCKDDGIEADVSGSITFPNESPVKNKVNSYEFTSGNPDNYIVETVDGELTMKKASVAITITAGSGEKTYDGQPLTNSEVTITEGELLPGDELVATATGSITNVADNKTGNNPVAEGYKIMHGDEDVTENYVITTEAGTLKINPAEVTITAKDKAFAYTGEAQRYPEYTVKGLVGDDEISVVVTGSIIYPSESPVTNKVDSYEFTKGDSANYNVTVKNGKLTMTNASAAITIKAADGKWTYDGTGHRNPEVTVTEGTLFPGDKLVATAVGNVTNVADTATGNNTVAEGYKIMHGDEDVTDNYAITVESGTLTVTKAPLTITAKDQQYTFIGSEQGEADTSYSNPDEIAEKVSVDGLCGNDTLTSITMNGTESDAGEYPDWITPAEASIGEDGNATSNYDINYVSGKLTINPKKVTVTAKSEEFTYDGQTHQNSGYDVEGLCNDDKIEADVAGSITFPSESPVTNKVDSYQFTSGDEKNYKVTTVDGQLTMVNAEKAIVIKAADDEWTYDGKAHSNKEVTLDEGTLFPGDTMEAVAGGSVTNVSDTKAGNNPVADGYKIMHGTEDVTKNYKITTKAGTLTIKKADDPAVISTDGKDTEVTVNTLEDDDHKIDLNQFVEGNEGDVTFEIKNDGSDASENASIDEKGNLIPGDETGKITVIVKIADSENHDGREGEIVIDVTPKETAKITVTQGDTTYGQDLPKPQITGVPDDVDNKDITIEYKKKGDTEYTTTPPTEAGEYTIRVTIPETSEHTGATAEDDFTITKAKDPAVIDVSGDVVKSNPNPEDTNSVNLEDLVKGAEGDVTFEIIPDGTTATDAKIDEDNNLVPGKETGEVKVKVTIADSENHTGKTEIITITVTDKDTEDITVTQKDTTYGEELPKPEYTAPEGSKTTVTYSGTLPDGTTVVLPEGETPTEAGTYIVTVTCETGDTIYTGKAEFEIKKAIPEIGTVNAKEVHNSTDIADAKVSRSDTTVPGKLTITETKLETGENTYHWTFVPEDTNNYETISGTVTITVTGHEWSTWEIVKPATTEKEGLARHVCTVCGEIETKPIPKLDPKKDPEEDPKPNPNPPIEYKVEGSGKATYIDDSYKDISFVIHRSTDDSKTTELFENIEVGGKKLVKGEDYTVGEGGTITFVSKYLETLPIGEVDLTVVFKDGTAKVKVVVKTNEPTPKTGDAGLLAVWFVLLGAVTVLLVVRRRREEEDDEVSGYMA